MQTDLFSNGAGGDSVRSLPPHLDPDRVAHVVVVEEQDRDHVAAAVGGVLPVGALGNNAAVWVVRVLDKAETVLHAESHASERAAWNVASFIRAKIESNRQRDFWAGLGEDSAVMPAGRAIIEPDAAGSDLPLFSS